jgi:MraZ protein
MSGYLGSYLHTMDDKGRLSLPSSFRKGSLERPLVLVHVFPDALTLYPEESWGEVEKRLRDLLRLQPDARPFVLRVTANAVEVTPDKAGRILVPQRLQDAVGISGSTLVVGAIDRMELWNPDRFAAVTGPAAPDAERFLHQVFG